MDSNELNDNDRSELNLSKEDVFVDASDTFRGVYINKGFDAMELEKPNNSAYGDNNNVVAVPKGKAKTSLVWNNLSYEVIKKKWYIRACRAVREVTLKQILKPQNGEIVAGTLTALMGPSGAGKSTLLNCLTGRYINGVRGEVRTT